MSVLADLQKLGDLAREIAIFKVLELAESDGSRIDVTVQVQGRDEEETIADVCGGGRSPYGLPTVGEEWIGVLIGEGLDDAYLIAPIMPFDDGSAAPRIAAGVTAWTPPTGDDLQVLARGGSLELETADGGDVTITSDSRIIQDSMSSYTVDAGGTIRFTVGGLTFDMTTGGKVSLGSATADVVDILWKNTDYLFKTCTTLSTSTTVTLLGPQPLTTGAVFAQYAVQLGLLRTALGTIRKVI